MPPLLGYDCTYIPSIMRGQIRKGKEINNSALFASVYIDIFHAGFAIDEATPVKLALAPLPDGRLLRVVSPTAAKEIATVHTGRGPIA